MPTARLKRQMGMAFVTLMTAEQATTTIYALNATRFQGRMMNMTSAKTENHPRRGIQRDATLRRSEQRQEMPKGNIQGQGATTRPRWPKPRRPGSRTGLFAVV